MAPRGLLASAERKTGRRRGQEALPIRSNLNACALRDRSASCRVLTFGWSAFSQSEESEKLDSALVSSLTKASGLQFLQVGQNLNTADRPTTPTPERRRLVDTVAGGFSASTGGAAFIGGSAGGANIGPTGLSSSTATFPSGPGNSVA